MVKGKPVAAAGIKSSKNGSCAVTAKKTRGARSWDSVPMCSGCGEVVDDKTKALQCERCIEVWTCASCLGLSDELYGHLITSSKSNLHWFCDKCEEVALDSITMNDKIIAMMGDLHSRSEGLEYQLLNSFAEIEQKLLDKVKSVEDMLQEKVENELLKSIEARLKKLEDRPVILEDVQQRLEHKVDQLRSIIDEPVVLAVQDALQQDKTEEQEIEKRKTNVIVHGIAKSQDDNPEQRVADDLSLLSVMLHEAGAEGEAFK